MEDVFKFLLVAAFIVIGLARQFKKEARGNADESLDMPLPDTDMDLPEHQKGSTHEQREESTYGGYIPEGPPPVRNPKPHRSYAPPKNGYFSEKASPPSPVSLPQESDEATSEYAIRSAEEARKAIIWSEILQRKY